MKRLFGVAKEKAPAPSLDDAVNALNTRGDSVEERIRKCDQQLAQFREQLKRTRPGPAQDAIKRRALTVLKQRKLYEGQREQLYNQQYSIEQVNFARQTMEDSQMQVAAMKAANAQLKAMNKTTKIEDIEALQDEMYDLVDYSNEIQEVMSRQYGVPEDIDEEELMGELDALETEMLTETAEASGRVPAYLAGPSELDELEALPSAVDATGRQSSARAPVVSRVAVGADGAALPSAGPSSGGTGGPLAGAAYGVGPTGGPGPGIQRYEPPPMEMDEYGLPTARGRR